MKAAVESIFSNALVALSSAYDPDKFWPGSKQLGFKDSGGHLCPLYSPVARPFEQSTAIPAQYVWAMRWSETEDWVFYSDGAAAATTRRIGFYKYNRTTGAWAWQGSITVTPMGTGNATIRGFRMTYNTYSTGTVQVSGTTVTGTGTLWGATAGSYQIAGGSRIGFGTTDPTQVTTWYEISPTTAPTDTGITLTAAGPTLGAGTPYVIEELRCVLAVQNATAANGGLFLCKGLRPEYFAPSPPTLAMATTTDRIRAVYWLPDAATITNQTPAGLAMESPRVAGDVDYVYVLDGAATSAKFYKYNIRAPLTGLSAGKPTNYSAVCPVITGTQTVTGNISQNNNCRFATAGVGGGPGNGVPSIYFVTASRVYRVATANIIASSTTFISDQMTEVPPGGTTTTAATGALSTIEHIASIDRFYIGTTGATAFRSYITNYRTDAGQIDHYLFQDQKYYDGAAADQRFGPLPYNTQSLCMNMWVEDGMAYIARHPLAAAAGNVNQNALFAVPLGADLDYADGNGGQGMMVFPRIATPGATTLSRVAVLEKLWYYDIEDGPNGEHYQLYYRTGGITDNSGAWIAVPDKGDLTGVTPGTHIQFAAAWNMVGHIGLPIRIAGLIVTYETDDALPSELRWNLQDSVDATGVVGFIQTAAFGVAPTTLTITYRRADTDAVVLTQASSGTTNGTFEYHNGSTWAAGLGPNTVGTRRRFTPTAGLPGVNVYAKITNP